MPQSVTVSPPTCAFCDIADRKVRGNLFNTLRGLGVPEVKNNGAAHDACVGKARSLRAEWCRKRHTVQGR